VLLAFFEAEAEAAVESDEGIRILLKVRDSIIRLISDTEEIFVIEDISSKERVSVELRAKRIDN